MTANRIEFQMYSNMHDMSLDKFLAASVRLFETKHGYKPRSIHLRSVDGLPDALDGVPVEQDDYVPENHVYLEVK